MNRKSVSLIVIGWSFLSFLASSYLSTAVSLTSEIPLTGYVVVSAIALAPLAVAYFKVFLPNSSLALMVHKGAMKSIASQQGWNFNSKAYPEAFWRQYQGEYRTIWYRFAKQKGKNS